MQIQDQTIFTIGHSNHEIDHFIKLLQKHSVTAVADVRSQPYSRYSHFNREPMASTLKNNGIQYVFLGKELGARREEKEPYQHGQAVYEKVAELPLFKEGIGRLLRGSEDNAIAIMCAEKEPLDCHRTVLVSRHLHHLGLHVKHILADGSIEEHETTEKRLINITDVKPDLFLQNQNKNDLLDQAYELRGEQIAYRLEVKA